MPAAYRGSDTSVLLLHIVYDYCCVKPKLAALRLENRFQISGVRPEIPDYIVRVIRVP